MVLSFATNSSPSPLAFGAVATVLININYISDLLGHFKRSSCCFDSFAEWFNHSWVVFDVRHVYCTHLHNLLTYGCVLRFRRNCIVFAGKKTRQNYKTKERFAIVCLRTRGKCRNGNHYCHVLPSQ